MTRFVIVAVLGWCLLATVVVGGFLVARRAALVTFGSEAAHDQWEDWVEEARKQSVGQGPVQRRIPKSSEPPALLLMRDYFGACLGMALGIASCVYGTFVWLLHGASRRKPHA